MRKPCIFARLVCTVSILAMPMATFAQNGNAGGAKVLRSGAGIEDIMVTARKREELLQKVPVVATDPVAQTLEQFQVSVLKSLATLVPRLSLGVQDSLRSEDPTDGFELIARGGYEVEVRERRADLIVSGPLSDTINDRLARTYGKQDGFLTSDTSLTLRGTTDANRGLALIGKNLSNKITTGHYANSDRAGGTSHLQQINGRGADVGTGGTDEIDCYTGRRRINDPPHSPCPGIYKT